MINTPRTPEAPRSLTSGRRYNEPDVVDTLLRDFLGKCYLCETTISAREHSVDHRKPQALFPELIFTWDNLFPACRDCNERRPAFPAEGLLDPNLAGGPGATHPPAPTLGDQMADIERARILEALTDCRGNQSEAARVLGIPRRTLVRRLRDYGISKKRDPQGD